MKAYVSDTDDLREDPMHQEIWDDMIINVRALVHNPFMKIVVGALFLAFMKYPLSPKHFFPLLLYLLI